jgi:hypothetical protein
MAKKHTAQCACGAIKFEFNTEPTFIAICHCLDCKKASGGEAATYFGVPEDDFTSRIRARGWIGTSAPIAAPGCLPTTWRAFRGRSSSIGSLDNPKGIDPVLEMFTKRRLEWEKPLDLPQFENMPS